MGGEFIVLSAGFRIQKSNNLAVVKMGKFINGACFLVIMVNKGYIIVASGLEPVHSFDLFGPLVDATLLGEQQVTLFEKIADVEGIDGQNAASIISDYRALLRGESWAVGDRKKGILDALYNPLKKHPKLTPNYQSTFQSDGLAVLGEIYGAGEQAIVFSTIAPEWLRT